MKSIILTLLSLIFFCLNASANSNRIVENSSEKLKSGEVVNSYTLKNKHGLQVTISTLGATITSLITPDKEGVIEDIVLGYDSAQEYFDGKSYFGGVVGRYANRINKGRFTLDGTQYVLDTNSHGSHLHGGKKGFNKRIWRYHSQSEYQDSSSITLALISKDGDQGYPGTLTVNVKYALSDDNQLAVEFSAVTDKKTIVNISQHSYFNLDGHHAGSVKSHLMRINADNYTPVNDQLIPVGVVASVAQTPFDFLLEKTLGQDINAQGKQIKYGNGYDHNFAINHKGVGEVSLVAVAKSKKSGRILTVYSDQPGVHLYTGNHLDGTLVGKNQVKYGANQGFCLETQKFPNSPNQVNFPSATLDINQVYKANTVFEFSVSK